MSKKAQTKCFNSYKEYKLHYKDTVKKAGSKGSKYYRIGAGIAATASNNAARESDMRRRGNLVSDLEQM